MATTEYSNPYADAPSDVGQSYNRNYIQPGTFTLELVAGKEVEKPFRGDPKTITEWRVHESTNPDQPPGSVVVITMSKSPRNLNAYWNEIYTLVGALAGYHQDLDSANMRADLSGTYGSIMHSITQGGALSGAFIKCEVTLAKNPMYTKKRFLPYKRGTTGLDAGNAFKASKR